MLWESAPGPPRILLLRLAVALAGFLLIVVVDGCLQIRYGGLQVFHCLDDIRELFHFRAERERQRH